jgi:hypothetical protein
MKISRVQIGAIGATLVVFASSLVAQLTSGNLTGSVFDPTGATVPGAEIVVKNNATGVEQHTTTTSAGQYQVSNLPVGAYTITVSGTGFKPAIVNDVNIVLNQTVTANVTLTVGSQSTTVQVAETVPNIDTSTAQIQNTFDTKQLADLPSASGGQNGTGVLNLSLLAPGVTSSGATGYGEGPSVGGQRPTNNNFTVEGIDNNNQGITGPIVTVPNDAVQEFSMLQNQFSPDFGHSSGGQFNEVVKSGTNQFHGALFEYFENRNLNAADNLSYVQGTPLHPRFDRNRFGGNVGGPIKKNKLFFFVDYEYNPFGQTASTFYFVPTQAGYNTLGNLPGINRNNLAQLQKYLGVGGTPAAASELPNGTPVLVAPGPGSNQSLQTGVFAPGGTGAISIPVGKISSSLPNYENTEYGVASVDYTLSDKDSIRGRFILNRNGTIDATGFPAVFFGIQPNNGYLATFSEYHTFTPSIINEFRFGYNRYYQDFPVFGNQSFPGLDQFPNINVYELNAAYGPNPNAPQFTIQNTYQLTDNVSWTHASHSFKFGFDGQRNISPSSFTQRARGDYEWSYLSDYLYDTNPDGIAQRSLGNVTYYSNSYLLSFYGNDQWKLRPNLTLTLGLRYEYQTVPESERTQILNQAASVPGLISFNTPTTQNTNFMPRVGVAYSPGNNGTTSIRAGFGLAYDVLYNNLGTLSLPPQLSTTVDVTGLDQTGFLANGGIKPSTSVTPPVGPAARPVTAGYIPNQQRPKSVNWNFGIQHVFAEKYTFKSEYTGTRGEFLPVQVQLNRQPVVTPSNSLPVYTAVPSQAVLNSLPVTLSALNAEYNAGGFNVPAYANAGFAAPITAFMPWGNSIYHGWSNSVSRPFSNGLQLNISYTWSHNIDDSTATLNSTVLAPRRPLDSQNLRLDRASSLLDHRNRAVVQIIYDLPYFKNRSWWLKNIVGNWEFAPVYIFQTGQVATAQSQTDSNLNGDSAPDRVIANPGGNNALGSGVQALTNSAGQTVAYLANNPTAGYILAPKGVYTDAGRNTLMLNPTNDIDISLLKRINVTERVRVEFSARVFNLLNHPQYVGGYLNDVYPALNFGQGESNGIIARNTLVPTSTSFQAWSQGFSSNPRQMQLALKLTF